MARKVLAISAHCGDVAIIAGGTLAKWVRNGDKVLWAAMTLEDDFTYEKIAGKKTPTFEELKKIRETEFRASCKILGIEGKWLGYKQADFYGPKSPPDNKAIVDIIMKFKPDVLLSHPPESLEEDHRLAGKLIDEATLTAVCTTPFVNAERYYYDVENAYNFTPGGWLFTDVTKTIDQKVNSFLAQESLLLCHGAMAPLYGYTDSFLEKKVPGIGKMGEKERLAKIGGMHWKDIIMSIARIRGFHSMRYPYAEALRPAGCNWS